MRAVLLGLAMVLAFESVPAAAQDLDPVRVEKRVTRLESEVRAVQRKIFPGGDSKYFEPEITAPPPEAPAQIGNPASAPLTDLSQRVSALESQLRTLTGQVEVNQFKLRQLEEAQTKLRGDVEFRLNTLEGNGSAAAAAPGVPPTGAPAFGSAGSAVLPPKPAPAKPAPVPVKAATADLAWKAAYANVLGKKWPETEASMTSFIADWPKSTRVPQAQYWLGRSHAERDQHAEAARAFLELYKTSPTNDRAPDALVGLATALSGLKKPKDACRVLGELDSVYGNKLTAAQKADAKALSSKAKCAA
jgi:TolA-binding protein